MLQPDVLQVQTELLVVPLVLCSQRLTLLQEPADVLHVVLYLRQTGYDMGDDIVFYLRQTGYDMDDDIVLYLRQTGYDMEDDIVF